MRWRTAGVWTLALFVTLASAVWQRMTGPTHPARGSVTLNGQTVKLRLLRTHPGEGGLPVGVADLQGTLSGQVAWRRYPSAEPWKFLPLRREDGQLVATLPHQPPAGKVEYQVRLRSGAEEAVFPPRPAVARFRGEVSPYILIPHILAMFLGMLCSTCAGIRALEGRPDLARIAWVTFAFLAVGGFLLGPAVQKMAFDAWWTGVPFGYDLTDNKTLVAGAAWALALWRLRSGRTARWAVAAASLATLAVFAIPHSAWGSQIQWDQVTPAP